MENNLIKRLAAIGKKYSTNITKDANKNLGKFKKLILVKSVSKVTNNVVEIISTGSPKETDDYGDVKNVARAYEFGSGTRSRSLKKSRHQKTAKGFIKISPRRRKVLAFHWDVATRSPENFTMLEDGRVRLPYVMHPGVQAANGGKGYLAPAITKNRKPMNAEIAKQVGEESRAVLRRAFDKRIRK